MGQVLQLEFAPYINRIISPPLRPVSSLISTTEIEVELVFTCCRSTAKLSNLENVLCSPVLLRSWFPLNFDSFKKEQRMVRWSTDSTRVYRHNIISVATHESHRPIDVFVTYDGRRAADIAVSRYAVRHLIATEVRAFSRFEPYQLTSSQIDASLVTRQAVAAEKLKAGSTHKRSVLQS
jgi:chromosome transmission fidelity protein 18